MHTRIVVALLAAALLCSAAELTVQAPQGPVDHQTILTGKAPRRNASVFVIVNPVNTPQQFWVQPAAVVDGRLNWTAAAYIGEPGSKHRGQQFVVVVVADPVDTLVRGDVLPGVPAARWTSKPILLTRR